MNGGNLMSLIEDLVKDAIKKASRTYGIVHKSTPAVMNGDKGFLIWDYILYNELTFLNSETGDITSLYHSFSDGKMEDRFNEFAKKYAT